MVSGPPAVIKTGPVILNHDVDLAAIDPRPTWADSESIGRVNPGPRPACRESRWLLERHSKREARFLGQYLPSTCRNGHAQSQTRSGAVGHNAISYRPLDKAVWHLQVRASKFGWTTFALRGRKRSCRGVPPKIEDFASRNRVVMLTSERDCHGYRHSEVVQFNERLRVHST